MTGRTALVSLGLLSVGLGSIGAVVPGMPATIFFLVASFLLARSSPRLHRWLMEHRAVGPFLRMAHRRVMPRRAKVVSMVSMWTGAILSCWLLEGTSRGGQLAALSLAIVGTVFLLVWFRAPSTDADATPASPRATAQTARRYR